jgi:predicted CoA-binding protein
MFTPESVAVIGATEAPGSGGRALVENLKSYRGLVYPVNLKRDTILGVPAYPKIRAVPDHIDLAIIATPAATVPEVVQECVEAGVTGALWDGIHDQLAFDCEILRVRAHIVQRSGCRGWARLCLLWSSKSRLIACRSIPSLFLASSVVWHLAIACSPSTTDPRERSPMTCSPSYTSST